MAKYPDIRITDYSLTFTNKVNIPVLHKTLTIINKLGLHARASAKLVDHASRYSSEIILKRGHQQANGKSIMGVMMLAASKGSTIELIINGDDEAAALSDLETLIVQRFGEAE